MAELISADKCRFIICPTNTDLLSCFCVDGRLTFLLLELGDTADSGGLDNLHNYLIPGWISKNCTLVVK